MNRDELVREVRHVGESLIKNAESIVGEERYLIGLTVTIDVSVDGNEATSVNISRDFLPERAFSKE